MRNALLIITDRTSPNNRYGPYIGEILRSEGLNGFRMEDLTDVNETLLTESGVVILTRCSVTEKTRNLLANYVAAGGQLIILAPEMIWEPLLGLTPLPTGTLDGYLKMVITQDVSRGLPNESFQFHGAARHWLNSGAQTLATLYRDALTPTGFPAVALHHHGEGRVVTFAFDLAESVATTRQGNARCAFSKLDDANVHPRPGDLFGAGWIDVSREHIPQADVQQALLARLIEMLSPTPLPRFWYLPGQARAILLLTGDGEAAEPANFHAQVDGVERYGGHVTFYLKEDTQITPEQEAAWRARGHGFGLHPFAGSMPTLQLVREHWPRQEALFRARFGHGSRTLRSHWLQWCGYVEQARLLADLGISMDTNFVSTRPSHGKYLTGSGRALRFVNETGEVLPVWQQPTQLEDDILLHQTGADPSSHTYDLSTDEGVQLAVELLTASMHRYHTPITMNVHPPFYTRFSGTWLDRTMAFAKGQGIPIWCAEEWLDFVEARDAALTEDVTYADGMLSFRLSGLAGDAGLTVCLPMHHQGMVLREVLRAGEPVPMTTMTVQQRSYAFIPLDNDGLAFEARYTPESE